MQSERSLLMILQTTTTNTSSSTTTVSSGINHVEWRSIANLWIDFDFFEQQHCNYSDHADDGNDSYYRHDPYYRHNSHHSDHANDRDYRRMYSLLDAEKTMLTLLRQYRAHHPQLLQ